ncbi:MAG: LamG domain-containing protein, partial [Flavobacteriales bacterium]|nr:LamG domain-containing protein [Flavobacteriales bacterium]
MKSHFFTSIFTIVLFCLTFSAQAQVPSNPSVATAIVVNTFPYTDYNVNTSLGGTNVGMSGGCVATCCSSAVYRVEIPMNGTLRIDNSNFSVLAGSFLGYTPDVPIPTSDTELTYYSAVGNFCGFRDSLELSGLVGGDVFYILAFNYNTQSGQGANSDFVFTFLPDCSVGYSCAYPNIEICAGDTYTSPSGNSYSTAGEYRDTLIGAAAGGLDSLIVTNLTTNSSTGTDVQVACNPYVWMDGNTYSVNNSTATHTLLNAAGCDSVVTLNLTITHTNYTQDNIGDTAICNGDLLIDTATTEYVSYSNFVKVNKNWIECNSIVPSLINTSRSVFTWMKRTTTVSGDAQYIVGMNTSGSGNICLFGVHTNEKLLIYDGANSRYGTSIITDGIWHYVGYTYDEVTNETKMYVDGLVENTYTNSQSITASSNRISIGQEFDGSTTSNFFEGLLTELTIWNEVLDSAEIAALISGTVEATHPKYANLLVYYPMITTCNADNSIIIDESPNGNHGAASHTNIQTLDNLEQISGFNSVAHYTPNWTLNGSSIATTNYLNTVAVAPGTYELELSNDYFTITDGWLTTVGSGCVICSETTASSSPIACDNYTSPSGNYNWTSSNTYMDTILNMGGCDSVLTINLTITNSTSGTDVQTACDSYLWIDGTTYTGANSTATYTLTNAAG